MAEHKEKKSFWQKFRNKYRLSILNDTTLEEVFWMRLSRMNIVSVMGVSAIIFAAIIFAFIAYTSIREFIPGFPDGETHKNIIQNVYRLDSVERKLRINQQYIDNIKTILDGKEPKNYAVMKHVGDSSRVPKDSISLSVSEKDSLFRVRIEQENEFDILSANVDIEDDFNLFVPMHGISTKLYDPKNRHYGIDIVSKKSKDVFACYRGTVIYASWSLETGYVVQIQHPNNLISVYKHLETINVKQGDAVSTGKDLGKIGDVGTLSTGAHLHFELWKNGQPLSPGELINFNL